MASETLQGDRWARGPIKLLSAAFSRCRRGLFTRSGSPADVPRHPLPARLSPQVQLDKLFAILDAASLSTERATRAHAAAAQTLDSAEYQLLRLFDEFPALKSTPTQPKLAPPRAAAQVRLHPTALAA